MTHRTALNGGAARRATRERHGMTGRRAMLAAAAIMTMAAVNATAQAVEAWQVEVGYDRLVDALGTGVPDGAGVSVSQVEAAAVPSGQSIDYNVHPYMPFPELSGEWSLGEISFVDVNNLADAMFGGQPIYSAHATTVVGARIYGNTDGLAKGVATVHMYEANDWLNNVLKYNGNQNPVAQNYRVQSQAWIGTLASQSGGSGPSVWWDDPKNIAALQRYDFLIDSANSGEGLTAVVGLNNNTNPLPYLLAQGYNSIAVGRSDGIHSIGYTGTGDGNLPDSFYGPNRSKPDLVGPGPSASSSTGMVSSTAVLLHDTLSSTPGRNAEVVKSILLAGAEKKPAFNWNYDASATLPSGALQVTRSLHDTWGAGEVDLWNSYLIATGGQTAGSMTEPTTVASGNGWDYNDLKNQAGAGPVYYTLEIPEGTTAQELSIALSWHVKVTDTSPGAGQFSPSHALQNLDLRLYDTTANFVLDSTTLVAESVSAVDNVEHLFFSNIDGLGTNDLGSGMYTLEVSGAGGWDYGLAWRMSTLFDQPSADFDGNGIVDGGDFFLWQHGAGTLQGALHSQGDADGDGDVDQADLAIYKATYGTSPATAVAATSGILVTGVPEPSAWLLAVLAAGAAWPIRRSLPAV